MTIVQDASKIPVRVGYTSRKTEAEPQGGRHQEVCLLKYHFLSCVFSYHSSITFLLESIAHGSWTPSEACTPVTLRLCLAELGWGGSAAHGKGRRAASGQGWWIRTTGTRREGQGSREGFPLGWTAPSLPTRTRQVPDPIPALSVAPERGWSCQVSLWQPRAEINASSWSLESREQGRAGSDHPRPGTWPLGIPRFCSSASKESLPRRLSQTLLTP